MSISCSITKYHICQSQYDGACCQQPRQLRSTQVRPGPLQSHLTCESQYDWPGCLQPRQQPGARHRARVVVAQHEDGDAGDQHGQTQPGQDPQVPAAQPHTGRCLPRSSEIREVLEY